MSIYDYLKKLNISYQEFRHKPIFTVEEGKEIDKNFPGVKTKNLFLRDKKKKNYFLLSLTSDKKADLKKLAKILKVDRLSFSNEEDLENILKTYKGAVSPFNLINDKEGKVILVIDKDILKKESVNFHPNDNKATLNLKTEDFIKYLNSLKNEVIYLDL
jgi:Ala-tRNA(Pro) deacylase